MKRKTFSLSFFAIFCVMIMSVSLFTGCFGDDDKTDTPVTPTPTTDTTAPTIVSITPADNTTGIDTGTSIIIEFNEAMDASTITGNTADGTCIGTIQISNDTFSNCWGFTAGTATPSNGDKTFTFTPFGGLDASSNYLIKITTGVTDAAGNPFGSEYITPNGFTTN